jgi:penicillin-binding protein 2
MAYSTTESRAWRLTILSTILFILLTLGLVRLQGIQGGYYRSLSEKNRLRLINLEGPRGNILDRYGKALAQSRLSFNVTAAQRESPTRIKKSFERLSAILGEPVETLEARYQKKKAGMYYSIVLAEDIPLPEATAVEEQMNLMPGLMIETKPLRTYPYADAAAHLVGFIGPQSSKETEDLEFTGYSPSDWIGRDGIEKSYESYLRGQSGGLQLEVNNRG